MVISAQAPEQPHRAHVQPRHVVEAVVHPVHDGGLVLLLPLARAEEGRGVRDMPDLPFDGLELCSSTRLFSPCTPYTPCKRYTLTSHVRLSSHLHHLMTI